MGNCKMCAQDRRECLRQTGQMPEEKVYFVSRRLRITEEGGVYTIHL